VHETANSSSKGRSVASTNESGFFASAGLVVVGIDQVKHKLTIDEIFDSTSVRVVEDLSALSGSLDEHGNVVTETQSLSITLKEYDELEDKGGFESQCLTIVTSFLNTHGQSRRT